MGGGVGGHAAARAGLTPLGGDSEAYYPPDDAGAAGAAETGASWRWFSFEGRGGSGWGWSGWGWRSRWRCCRRRRRKGLPVRRRRQAPHVARCRIKWTCTQVSRTCPTSGPRCPSRTVWAMSPPTSIGSGSSIASPAPRGCRHGSPGRRSCRGRCEDSTSWSLATPIS